MLSAVIKAWRRRLEAGRLRKERIPIDVWLRIVQAERCIARLEHQERHRLRILATQFLSKKAINGAGTFELDEYAQARIAALASLLILNLGLDYYEGWSEVIVYPGAFVVNHAQRDEAGLMHKQARALSGEAWTRGPVILSWEDVARTDEKRQHGVNVVLHEFAHKLDMLNGAADGYPPLHATMHPAEWTDAFRHAYDAMLRQVEFGRVGRIDPYAVESPAEFFAVVSEFFFERPQVLFAEMPDVYAQLAEFYRQEPLAREG